MKKTLIGLGAALLFGSAGAQQLMVFGPNAEFESARDCAHAKTLFRGDAVRTVCYGASGGATRCADVPLASLDAFCERAGREVSKGFLDRLLAIGRDISQGSARTGGRRATQDTCMAGLPEGELLLPDDQLALNPRDTGLGELFGVVLTEDARGARPAAQFASVAAQPAVIDGTLLRGRSWVLSGRTIKGSFECRFSVIGGADADKLRGEYRTLNATGAAAQIERAAFFRQHDFPHEYWRTIGALKQR